MNGQPRNQEAWTVTAKNSNNYNDNEKLKVCNNNCINKYNYIVVGHVCSNSKLFVKYFVSIIRYNIRLYAVLFVFLCVVCFYKQT